MLRIAELPLNRIFESDSKNLAIPIILNQSSPIDLVALNDSFLGNNISLKTAALYQSVDFNSLNLIILETLKNSLIILVLNSISFQLINIQIFPSEKLKL